VRIAVLVAALLVGPAAWAYTTPPPPDDGPTVTTVDYAHDLLYESPPKQLFAARELRRQAKHAAKVLRRARGDRALEARILRRDLLQDAGPAMAATLENNAELRAIAADFFGYVGEQSHLPSLDKARAAESRPAVIERLEAARRRILADHHLDAP
jgi:hypothetical protein